MVQEQALCGNRARVLYIVVTQIKKIQGKLEQV
jgi:hypothetical protein